MSDSPADLQYRRLPIRRTARVLVVVTLAIATIFQLSSRPHGSTLPTTTCNAHNHCFRATEQVDFPTFGNVYPSNLSDCMFAAAADWQIIVLKRTPSTSAVIDDYRRAAVSDKSGINEDVFYWYWTTHGIDGRAITDWHVINDAFNRSSIERAIRKYRAVFAIFDFHEGDTLGGDPVSVGGHAAIIDGYSAKGPLVVTWGTTYQMSWAEYWRSVSSLRQIVR